MKVLFLESHPMWIYGLPNGFRDLGHDVTISGPLTEKKIPQLISQCNPDLIFTMGWTPEHIAEKLNWIRKYVKSAKIPLIYWATEDPAYMQEHSLPLIQKTMPDFVFTICLEKVNYYRKLGIKAAHLTFGYHESVHHRIVSSDKYKTSIALVANAYPQYIKNHPDCFRNSSLNILVKPILKSNIRIDFWGRGWDEMKPFLDFDIPKEWIHGYLLYTEANKVYSSADIVIGLQNRQLTQRTYEVLGSEGFLLTNDTAAVRQIFINKRDLIISSSEEETLKLVNYYLAHRKEREEIRKNGKLAVACHSYKQRAEYVIQTLIEQEILSNKSVSL